MSGSDPTEKKAKSSLVRLGQNEGSRKMFSPVRPSMGSPLGSPKPLLGTGMTFKAQRDLTLGAKPVNKSSTTKPLERKKFVPNLNVQRLAKKENNESVKVDNNPKAGRKKKENFNKHDRRDRNFKDRPTLIQTGSIFSEGIGGDAVIRRRSAGFGSRDESASSALVKPKLNLNIPCHREDEEQKLKSILRDDFIDDLKEGNFVPVQLPMVDTGKMFKSEAKKVEPIEEDIKPRLLSIKKNELDSDDEDDPIAAADKTQSVITKDEKTLLPSGFEPSVAQLLRQQTGELVFFQLPDAIPVETTHEGGNKRLNIDSLGHLEGKLGSLQIRKSGRCQLVLGQEKFDVETGTKVGFLQDVVSVRIPPNKEVNGELTILGHVSHRLVLSPDWDSLLRDSGLNETLA